MKYLPKLLIRLRLLIGVFIFCFSFYNSKSFAVITIVLIAVSLLTDIFDGIIARRLNISTPQFRRLDSTIDQIFWILIAAACYIKHPDFFKTNAVKIIILFAAELAAYLVSFIKFKKEVATHAISSKLWTLLLFATLIQIIATSSSTILFNICFITGLVTRAEIIIILLLIRQWTNDVPSVYHAVLLRKGKPIKRNRLFNG